MENIFPEIRPVTKEVLCECIGASVRRVVDFMALTSPLPQRSQPELSTHVREPNPQGVLDFPEGFGF